MPSWIEFRLACQGLYRLALLDRGFLRYFDLSAKGALRSFRLAVPLFPIALWQIWLSIDETVPSAALFMFAKSIGYAYGWILFPFVILFAARLTDRHAEAPGCIAVYNWSSLLWAVLQLPILILATLGIAPDLTALLNLAMFVASIVIEGFFLMACLRIALWQAAILVVIDVVLGQGVIWPISTKLGCMPLG
jgi:hypothetical protein